MQEITRINHMVANLEQARKFYEQLGFIFIVGPIGLEPVAIMEHLSGININFILNANAGETSNILMDNPVKYPGYTHIALEVTDINAVQHALKNKGIAITDGPITLPDGALMLFIRDPDKNVIEFHQPRSQPYGINHEA